MRLQIKLWILRYGIAILVLYATTAIYQHFFGAPHAQPLSTYFFSGDMLGDRHSCPHLFSRAPHLREGAVSQVPTRRAGDHLLHLSDSDGHRHCSVLHSEVVIE